MRAVDNIIEVREADCRSCYRCIRHCALKAISCRDDRTRIIREECIYCGRCVLECGRGARVVTSDRPMIEEALRRGEKLYVSVAPSFPAAFNGINLFQLSAALKKLGFTAVEETAIGAEQVTRAYEELIASRSMPNIITSSCVALNLLVQKRFPELLPQLAPVLTPALTHAKMMHAVYGSRARVVHIGPCIAKKAETGKGIFAALTFLQLREWLDERGIDFGEEDRTARGMRNRKMRYFPAAGGIAANLKRELRAEYESVSVDGVEECIEALETLSREKPTGYFFEMNICRGGCLGSVVMRMMNASLLHGRALIKEYARSLREADIPLTDGIAGDYSTRYRPLRSKRPPVDEALVQSALRSMGKAQPSDFLNCGCCGYESCRDKAIAIVQGKASPDMCVSHMRRRAENRADAVFDHAPLALLLTDEEGRILRANAAAVQLFSDGELSGRSVEQLGVPLLNPQSGLTDVRELSRPECGLYAEMTTVSMPYNRTVLYMLKDNSGEQCGREEIRRVREESVRSAREAMRRQSESVRRIAALLGEAAAESRTAVDELISALERSEQE